MNKQIHYACKYGDINYPNSRKHTLELLKKGGHLSLIQVEFISSNGHLVSYTGDEDYANNSLYDWIYDIVHGERIILWIDLKDINSQPYSCLNSLQCLSPSIREGEEEDSFKETRSILNQLDDLRTYFLYNDPQDSYQFSFTEESEETEGNIHNIERKQPYQNPLFIVSCDLLGCIPIPSYDSSSMVESYDEDEYEDSYGLEMKEKEEREKRIEYSRKNNLKREKKVNIDISEFIIIGSSSDQDVLTELITLNENRLEKWNIIADIPFSMEYFMKHFMSKSTLSSFMFRNYSQYMLFSQINWIALDLSFFANYDELLSFIRILPHSPSSSSSSSSSSTNKDTKRHIIVYAFTVMLDETQIPFTHNEVDNIHIIPQFLYK